VELGIVQAEGRQHRSFCSKQGTPTESANDREWKAADRAPRKNFVDVRAGTWDGRRKIIRVDGGAESWWLEPQDCKVRWRFRFRFRSSHGGAGNRLAELSQKNNNGGVD
jgi:hypothetical protein